MNLDLLRRIVDAPGVSGFEDEAQALARAELEQHADEVWRDRMGNVIAVKYAQGGPRSRGAAGAAPGAGSDTAAARPRRLLYAAHIDEIGMMVSHIDDDGFVRFRTVGGLDPRTLPSERVVVHGTKAGPVGLKGVIAPQSGWLGTDQDRQRVFPVKELYIDLGRSAADVRAQVHVGDVITMAAQFDMLNDDVVVGRNFDDRIGVFCLLEAFKRIVDPPVDVYAVSTVQEEVGVRGIPTAAHAVEPDIALAIDGSLPSDTPYAQPEERQCRLGDGTGIYLMDNRTIGNPGLIRGLIETCESRGIAYQRNLGGATDASEIQRRNLGAWATTIGAPTRYMHSTVQLCHLADVEATIQLLATFPYDAAAILPADWR
jgi:endoglucanase